MSQNTTSKKPPTLAEWRDRKARTIQRNEEILLGYTAGPARNDPLGQRVLITVPTLFDVVWHNPHIQTLRLGFSLVIRVVVVVGGILVFVGGLITSFMQSNWWLFGLLCACLFLGVCYVVGKISE